MFESESNKKAYEIIKVIDKNFKNCSSSKKWNSGEKMCQFLKPIYEITNMMSGSFNLTLLWETLLTMIK